MAPGVSGLPGPPGEQGPPGTDGADGPPGCVGSGVEVVTDVRVDADQQLVLEKEPVCIRC